MKTKTIQNNRIKAKKLKNNLEYSKEEATLDNTTNYIPSCTRYEISLTKNQRRIINDNLASVRKLWNVGLHDIKKSKTCLTEISEVILRDKFVIKKQMSSTHLKELDWTFRTQKRIREYAIKDLVASIKQGTTKIRRGQIKKFIINTKSKNDEKQSMVLCHENSYIKNNKLHVYGMDFQIKEQVEDMKEINHNMRLIKEGPIYYVCIPKFSPFAYKDETSKSNMATIDLGVNIFAAYISPDNEWGEVGIGFKRKLLALYNKHDSMKNKNIRFSAIKRVKKKIFDLVDDFQWKTAHWFLKSFKEILVSRLYVGKAKGLTRRLMNDSNHCRFVDRLNYLSMFYKDRVVHTGHEGYTSSHCTKCGSMNVIKGSTIKCKDCDFIIHRDLAGCRNFMIKYSVCNVI